MKNKIVEVTDDSGNVTHHLKNSKGKTIVVLDTVADEILSEVIICDGFIEASYVDRLGSEFRILFNINGQLLKKGILSIEEYISERNEFIITINSEGDDFTADYLIQSSYDEYFAVIDSNGSYIIQPLLGKIEFIAGLYQLEKENYYKGSEFVGNLIDDFGDEMLMKNEQGYYFYNTLKQNFTERYDSISKKDIQIGDCIYFIAKKNGKFGIIDTSGKRLVEFNYDWIDEDFDSDENITLIVKKDNRFSLITINESAEVSNFSRTEFEFCKFINVKERGKLLVGFDTSGLANLYQLDKKLKTISSGSYSKEISNKIYAIIRVEGKYGVVDNGNSKKPLLPFIYDNVQLIYAEFYYVLNFFPIMTFNNTSKLYEIWDLSQNNYEANEFTPLVSDTNKEKAFDLYRNKIKIESIEQFLMN